MPLMSGTHILLELHAFFFFFYRIIVFRKAWCLILARSQRTPNMTQVDEPLIGTFSTDTAPSREHPSQVDLEAHGRMRHGFL